jgi:5-methylcytosine-specific restriction endonuclease McrA
VIHKTAEQLAYMKQWRECNRERQAQTAKAYWAAHKEYLIAQNRAWKAAHKEQVAKTQKVWRSQHREVLQAHIAKRSAMKRNASINDFAPQQWLDMLDEYRHACGYCLRTDVPLTQDHIIPLSKGGDHTASNIAPACLFCNQSKHDKTPLEYLVYLQRA